MAYQKQHVSVAQLTGNVSSGLEAVYAGRGAKDDCEDPRHAHNAKG